MTRKKSIMPKGERCKFTSNKSAASEAQIVKRDGKAWFCAHNEEFQAEIYHTCQIFIYKFSGKIAFNLVWIFFWLFIHWLIHLSICPYMHSSIHPCIHLSIHKFIHPSIYPSFIHSAMHSSTHPSIHQFIQTLSVMSPPSVPLHHCHRHISSVVPTCS